jgi:hypothetical protein
LQNITTQSIQEVYTLLTQDEERNQTITQDVIAALGAGRSPVLLTERREHLDLLANMLTQYIQNIIVMTGGMGKKQRRFVRFYESLQVELAMPTRPKGKHHPRRHCRRTPAMAAGLTLRRWTVKELLSYPLP